LLDKYISSIDDFFIFLCLEKMFGILVAVMVLSAAIFTGSVLLMSPKGGLGMGIGGFSQGGEYGSKKSLEGKLKYVALITSIVFILAVLFIPYFLPSAGA
jgi:preprotein translocase subunit SecG